MCYRDLTLAIFVLHILDLALTHGLAISTLRRFGPGKGPSHSCVIVIKITSSRPNIVEWCLADISHNYMTVVSTHTNLLHLKVGIPTGLTGICLPRTNTC